MTAMARPRLTSQPAMQSPKPVKTGETLEFLIELETFHADEWRVTAVWSNRPANVHKLKIPQRSVLWASYEAAMRCGMKKISEMLAILSDGKYGGFTVSIRISKRNKQKN